MAAHIGLIGFGEVGQIFGNDLVKGGAGRVSTYDIVFDTAGGEERKRLAVQAGVVPAREAKAAIEGADIVISAVTADRACEVARAAASHLAPGQIFLDINSASPTTKRAAAEHVHAKGAAFVEGAVMAAVSAPRLRVPILAGGPWAARTAEILNPLGMNITPISEEVGRASAIKLCRSIMIKGIEALILDCSAAASRWGVEREVYASLGATFPSIIWAELAPKMAERVGKHGLRRAAEMREAAQMLDELGLDPKLSAAVADAQEAFARQTCAKRGA